MVWPHFGPLFFFGARLLCARRLGPRNPPRPLLICCFYGLSLLFGLWQIESFFFHLCVLVCVLVCVLEVCVGVCVGVVLVWKWMKSKVKWC